ncbi:hypothetical protein [uncultured Sulfitobacter sp.]|uniref:hypothetical protein n=1 Tax=uncultured Sulfitobacter sp. TaxID=191468 RepID=UPI002639CB35|nr:hypothetical protein [uncultured Sulfitobacter sp.]
MFDWDDGGYGADQFQFQNDPFEPDPWTQGDPSSPHYDPWGSGTLPNGAPAYGSLGVGDAIGGILGGIGDALGNLGGNISGFLSGDLGDLFGWGLENGFLEGIIVSDENGFTATIQSPLNGTAITVNSSSGSITSIYIR